MTTKTVTAKLAGEGLRLIAETGSGHSIVMDDAVGDHGPRPAELLFVALAGCTAMDVVSILRKKRQPFGRYEIRVTGEQRTDPPHSVERVRVIHVVTGDVDVAAVRRAIELSATKYCAVSATLASGVVQVHHAYVVRDASGEEHYGEVIVTGPHDGTAMPMAQLGNVSSGNSEKPGLDARASGQPATDVMARNSRRS